MPITPLNFLKVTDKLARMFIALKGSVTAPGFGYGDPTIPLVTNDWGYSKAAREMEIIFLGNGSSEYGMGDIDVVSTAVSAIRASRANGDFRATTRSEFSEWFRALDAACRTQGFASIIDARTYLEYYNFGAGGAYTALVAPDFADMWLIRQGFALDPRNVYSAAVTSMGTLTGAFPGVFATGTAIDPTTRAGVLAPQVSANAGYTATGGYSGANATVLVTGTGRTPAGVDISGRTWNAVITAAGVATYALVPVAPTVAGTVLLSVTAISHPSISAGALTVSAIIPTGRTNPPA